MDTATSPLDERRNAELCALGDRLRGEIAEAQKELDMRRRAGAALLAPLQRDMKQKQEEADAAVTAFEQCKAANQSAEVPLVSRIAELTKRLNAPALGFGTSSAWRRPDWHTGGSREELQLSLDAAAELVARERVHGY